MAVKHLLRFFFFQKERISTLSSPIQLMFNSFPCLLARLKERTLVNRREAAKIQLCTTIPIYKSTKFKFLDKRCPRREAEVEIANHKEMTGTQTSLMINPLGKVKFMI